MRQLWVKFRIILPINISYIVIKVSALSLIMNHRVHLIEA